MSEKLKPCPFCGSDQIGGVHDTVYCGPCGASVKDERPLSNAIAKWNRRAALSEQAPVFWLYDGELYEVQQHSIATDEPLPDQTPLYAAPVAPAVPSADRELREAVWNLMQQKGRHNTEIAYQRLEQAYLKAVKSAAPKEPT